MTTARKPRTKFYEQVITSENIHSLAQQIAYTVVKTSLRLMRNSEIKMKLLRDLASDFNNRNVQSYAFTNAYDLVQVAGTFFSEHIGKSLDSPTSELQKNGNFANVYRACYRTIDRHIYKFFIRVAGATEMQDYLAFREVDYVGYDIGKTIEKLELTNKQSEVVARLSTGLQLTEIGQILKVSKQAAWTRVEQVRKKYNDRILALA